MTISLDKLPPTGEYVKKPVTEPVEFDSIVVLNPQATVQLDLFGYTIPYSCKKCGKCFGTMRESSKHHAIFHKNRQIKKVSVNFALENFCLISTREVILS